MLFLVCLGAFYVCLVIRQMVKALAELPCFANEIYERKGLPKFANQHWTPEVRYISVDGNIGSGKSTLISLLQRVCPRHIKLLHEPVGDWEELRDGAGVSLLKNFYASPSQYGSTFQMVALFTRARTLLSALSNTAYSTVISERSIFTDRDVFAQMLFSDGTLSSMDYNAYILMFNWFKTQLKLKTPPITIFLNTSPEVCLERIRNRHRDGECSIQLPYLQQLHEQHLAYLTTVPTKFVIDGNRPVEDVLHSVLEACGSLGIPIMDL